MITIKINRLFHRLASLRDYQVTEALAKGQDIKIVLGEKYIIVPFSRLTYGLPNREFFNSKHISGQKYSLVDYHWEDYKENYEEQKQLFDTV